MSKIYPNFSLRANLSASASHTTLERDTVPGTTVGATLRSAMLASCVEGRGSVVYCGAEVVQESATLHLLQELAVTGAPHGVLSRADEGNLLQVRAP